MYPHRTTVAENIVTEFFPPYLGEKEADKDRVIIFCDGQPGMPGNDKAMQHFSKKGFWTFYPRYRGSWESGGEMLLQEPTQDMLDVVTALQKPLKSAWTGEAFSVKNPEVYLIGISFGGPAAILGSKDERVKKAISLSGVIDWPAGEEYEPMDELFEIMQNGYGSAYRVQKENWEKLARGEMYNPATQSDGLDAKKLLLIHSVDDNVVPVEPTRAFAKKYGCKYIELKKGKHVTTSALTKWNLSRKVLKFLNE